MSLPWQVWLLILIVPPYWWPAIILGVGFVAIYHGLGFARRAAARERARSEGLYHAHERENAAIFAAYWRKPRGMGQKYRP